MGSMVYDQYSDSGDEDLLYGNTAGVELLKNDRRTPSKLATRRGTSVRRFQKAGGRLE